ncbi:MAG: hypothetical protein LBH96_00840 [Candidatus Peribacteria bacterium]|jgi:hypothetical protein|nr:hypothetical protein [Candidatus Peribacteria bacterium]
MEETNNLERINHSKEIAWKHREIENFITERLREVLILSNMKTEKYHSIPMLEFNQDWEIVEGTEKYFLKDPVGITGKVEDIHLLNILKEI